MDNTLINNPATADIASLNRKLDSLLASVAEIAEKQNINEAIQIELVSFFQNFRNELLQSSASFSQELRSAAESLHVKTNTLIQYNTKVGEVLQTQFKELAGQTEQVVADHVQGLKQLAHIGLRERAPGGSRIRCVFLVHMIEAWDAQIDVYQAMRNDARFDPIVISINRVFPGDDRLGGEDIVSAALTELGIDHLRLGMQNSVEALDILRFLAPDVIFRQSHWDRDYPPAFHTSEITFSRLCIIPYGLSIVQKFQHSERNPEAISQWAFDQVYHRSAWRVFCETAQTQSFFRSFQHSDPNKFILSGYPKHERLMKAIGQGKWPLPDGDARPYRVIWAPHHSVGNEWLAFGVFHTMYRQMLEWAARAPEKQFVLKPHPALFALVVKMNLMSQSQLNDFLQAWSALPNCTICEGQYADLFAASDLMLTDGLSFLTEYQLFDKPLVFIDSRRHVPLNALGQMAVECAHTVFSFVEAQNAVNSYASGKIWGFEEQRQRLRTALLPFEEPSSRIIVDAIADGILAERVPVEA